jgi:hypothetical protein
LETATAVKVVQDGQPPEDGPPASFQEMLVRITSEANALCVSKQKDYGPANIAGFGEIGVLIRLNDKFQRLKNLLTSGKSPKNESVEDTWIDLLNYSVIGLAVHRGWWSEKTCPPLLEERG